MKILFRRGDCKGSDIWDRIIMAATGGPWVHTELEFDNGCCFSSQAPNGVHLIDGIDVSDKDVWEVISLPWKETSQLLRWAESIVGLPYDYVGAISSGIGAAVQLADRWFCSESSIEGMSRAGAMGIPSLLCPNALHCFLTALLLDRHTTESVCRHVQQYSILRSKQVAQIGWATNHLEAVVQGWQVQIQQGQSPEKLSKDIECWYNMHTFTDGNVN